MIDSHIRPFINPPLKIMAHFLVKLGITANGLTAVGFILSLLSFTALAFAQYNFALLFILLNRLTDGLDGAVARVTVATDLGGYYDIVSDFVFYAGTIFFFAVGKPEVALSAAFLIFTFMCTGTAFLAHAIVASKHEINHDKQGEKSFFYVSGLAEGSETIIALSLICIIPDYFTFIAYIYGIICLITTIGRVFQAKIDFQDK